MKTAFTLKKWGFMLAFLSSMLLYQTSFAQKNQAKCPGFTANITNGSVINLCAGSSVTLAAAPVVSGYTYQWQAQTTAGGPFANVSGATGSTYSTTNLAAYRVIVNTGSCIDTSGITSVIRLVIQGGTITPSTTALLCRGETGGKITGNQVAGADAGFVTYSWETNVNNTGWQPIAGATDVNYSVGIVNSPVSFRRKSTDNCGNSAYSNIATLNLVPDLIGGAVTPATQTVVRNQIPAPINNVTAASGGSGNLSYQWYSSPWLKGPYVEIPGATSASYSPGGLQETYYFKRVVKDNRCFTSAEANVAEIIVTNSILNAGTFIIGSQCFFPGQRAATLQTDNPVRGGTPPYTIQWQSSPNNLNWSDIPGANGITYDPGVLSATTWFRKKVTDAAGTVAYSSSEVITMITTTFTGGSIQAGANVACLGSSPAGIGSTGSPTGYFGLSYQWQYKNNSTNGQWVDIVGQDREGLYPSPITEKTTYRRVAKDYCGTSMRAAYSNEVVIDVKPAIMAGDISPTAQMVRANQLPKQLVNVTAPSGGTGVYGITWEVAPLAVGPFTTVSNATGLSYQPPVTTQSVYYRRAVMDSGCLATKYTYIVEVFFNTAPPITGGNLAGSSCVFSGSRPSVITTGSTPPANGNPPFTYQWETRPGIIGTWTVIAGATSETYQPPVVTQTTQYRRKVIDRWGEFAYSTPFTVNYVTTPINPGTIAATTSTVCSGSIPATINSVTAATTAANFVGYQWQMKVSGGQWVDITGETKAFLQPGAINQKTYFRRLAMDKCSEVTRTAFSNEVVIDLAVVTKFYAGLVDGPFITCTGTAPGMIRSVLDGCAGTAAVKYQWEYMNNGTWTAITGATSASYTPGAITDNMIYRRKAYTDCGNVGYSNNVEIYVYPPIEPGVIGAATQTVCASNGKPEMIKLMTDCHYTDGTVTYQWQSATAMTGPWTDIAGATTNQYQPMGTTVNMYYQLVVKSTTCNMTATTNVASVMVDAACRPIAGERAASDMKVYPNPVTGNSLEVKLETKGAVKVALINNEGRALPVSVSNTGAGLMRVTSSSKTLAPGMYLLTVKDEAGSHTSKIMVQ